MRSRALGSWIAAGTLIAGLVASSGCRYEGDDAGECDDGVDNDRDRLRDCDDPGCADAVICVEADDDDDTDAGQVCGRLTGDVSVEDALAWFVPEHRDDEAGLSVSCAGDQDGNGHDDVLIGAPGESGFEAGSGSGAVYLVHMPVQGQVLLGDVGTVLDEDSRDDRFGYAVDGGGDANGDGVPDVAIGAPSQEHDVEVLEPVGRVHLFRGPVSGHLGTDVSDATVSGENYSANVGTAVSFAGDVNADGFDDLLVGSPEEGFAAEPTNLVEAGAAYLVHGSLSGLLYVSDADASMIGVDDYDFAGHAVAGAGDVNADGYDDVLVGAPQFYRWGLEDGRRGRAYLLFGPVEGEFSLELADRRFDGVSDHDHAGLSVAGAGDVNGDGLPDVLIGAPGDPERVATAGSAYLLYGPVDEEGSLEDADVILTGEATADMAGQVVTSGGDLDGDGFSDILVSAPGAAGLSQEGDAGVVYVLYGPVSDDRGLGDSNARIAGGSYGHEFGCALDRAGDVDGDGYPDLVIGACERSEDTFKPTAYTIRGCL